MQTKWSFGVEPIEIELFHMIRSLALIWAEASRCVLDQLPELSLFNFIQLNMLILLLFTVNLKKSCNSSLCYENLDFFVSPE